MKPTTCGIYTITHIETGKLYVGSSIRIEIRCSDHRRRLNNGKHSNPKLLAAWTKYGSDAFQFSILEVVTSETDLIAREQHYLDTFHPFFNCVPADRGRSRPVDVNAKVSTALKGRKASPEARAKQSDARKAYWQANPSAKAKARELLLQHATGRDFSDEYKAKISASLMGNKRSAGRTDLRGRRYKST